MGAVSYTHLDVYKRQLLTTPPGSYESFRQRRRRRTYAVNPRTATAVETIRRYAGDHRLLVWDMYDVVGGKKRACKNWTEAKLMRPDHVHYLPEGYIPVSYTHLDVYKRQIYDYLVAKADLDQVLGKE